MSIFNDGAIPARDYSQPATKAGTPPAGTPLRSNDGEAKADQAYPRNLYTPEGV